MLYSSTHFLTPLSYTDNLLPKARFGNLPISPNTLLLSTVQTTNTKAAAQNIKMFIKRDLSGLYGQLSPTFASL
jgi:hypothetical protein